MKKMLPWLISLMLAITLIVSVGIYMWNQYLNGDAKDPQQQVQETVQSVEAEPMTADELTKVTSELTNIRTNLLDPGYVVQMSFAFQLDSPKAKEEFDLIKEIQVKPIINRALWDLKPDDLNGTKGKDELCAKLINAINEVLTEGNMTKVVIQDFLMQQI